MNIPAQAQTSQSNSSPTDSLWDFFDRIYCISLMNRPDRRQEAQKQFSRVGLADRVEFVIVEKDPTDSEHGIYLSHQLCLRKGLDSGAQTILVFEDDVLFLRFSEKHLERAIRFLRTSSDWGIFFFGCFVYSSRKTRFRSIVKVRYRCTAHAYVVSNLMAQNILAHSWGSVAYDDQLRSIAANQAFAIFPAFAFQSGSRTDNTKLPWTDRIRRMLGGGRILQRWNEFSSRRWTGILIVHSAIVLTLILVIVLGRGGHGVHLRLPFFHGN